MINKHTITTLEGFKVKQGRQVGNSTRQLNLALRLLKKGEIVKVMDHWEHGKNTAANYYLFGTILDKLNELNIDYNINKNKLLIKLK